MEVFKDYAYYYNAFYQDKDYRAEALQVDSPVSKNKKKKKNTSLLPQVCPARCLPVTET